jgi:hypothetical protein
MRAFDKVDRTSGVKVVRKWPPRGPVPARGAKANLHEFRLHVKVALTEELWDWLQDRGFREITYSPDRRRYRDLPPSLVSTFLDAPNRNWGRILKEAMAEAAKRPVVGVAARRGG